MYLYDVDEDKLLIYTVFFLLINICYTEEILSENSEPFAFEFLEMIKNMFPQVHWHRGKFSLCQIDEFQENDKLNKYCLDFIQK